MRFKAKLAADQVSLLYHVITPLSRLQQQQQHPNKSSSTSFTPSSAATTVGGAVVYLDPDYVRISCKSSEIHCFAELSRDIFWEHRIESAADNVICFQIDLISFKMALQSVVLSGSNAKTNNKRSQQGDGGNPNNSHETSVIQSLLGQQLNHQHHQQVTIKLAKRNGLPCLCLDGTSSSRGFALGGGDAVEIHQAIPIRILRHSEMQYHLPPKINTPSVQLELPLERPLKAVIEKLKSMGQHVYLEGNMKGELTIRLDHDGASLACFYSGLQPRWDDEEDDDDNDENARPADSSCVLKVDASKLAQCLQWQSSPLPVTSCLLGMVHNEMLVLHILLHPEALGFFTYYLPVYYIQEDEM